MFKVSSAKSIGSSCSSAQEGHRKGESGKTDSLQNRCSQPHLGQVHSTLGPRNAGSIELPATHAVRGVLPRLIKIKAATDNEIAKNKISPMVLQRNHRLVFPIFATLLLANTIKPFLGPDDPVLTDNSVGSKDPAWELIAMQLFQ